MKPIIKVYPSGMRLVVQPMPNFKSVSTNIFIAVGSRDEEDNEHGLSHFVEHMLFKGTTTRSAEDISSTLDGLGVDLNAYTSNDATCYWTKGIAVNTEQCVDVMSDMYFNTQFADEDFYKEAEVIVQEIHMRDDEPRSAMFDLARETFFTGTPLGHDIAGTVEDIRGYKPEDIYNYIKKHYIPSKTIVSFSGDITIEKASELAEKYFESKFEKQSKPKIKNTPEDSKVIPNRVFVTKVKDTEQHNMTLFFPIVNNVHPDRYIWAYIYEILAAGMSSRLFSSVREKLGLVYSISGGVALYDIGGYFYIWFSCTPNNTKKVLETIKSEIEKFKQEGPTQEEMSKVRNQRECQELFNAEQTHVVNARNATSLAEFNKIKSLEEYLSDINKVTINDVLRVSNQYLKYDNAVLAGVGREFAKEVVNTWNIC
ncbi:MAG: insulinase family protein [Firmicutes bacterium]|nr:insulinase family protein [Bacillota bacterium]